MAERAAVPPGGIALLWTGGWDSTFRLLQALLVEHRAVQPIYFVNPGRKSLPHELRAMDAIRHGVRARLDHPGLLAPTQMFTSSHFPPDPQLVLWHATIAAQGRLGTQYLWLAAAAQALHWDGVEMSIERHADGPGLVPYLQDEHGRRSTRPEGQLFARFSFPVLHLTKADMRAIAAEHGFLDLLRLRWFCHHPLGRRPCGRCRPCRLAEWDGLRPAFRPAVRGRDALVGGRRRWRALTRGTRRVRPAPGPN